MLWTRRPGQAVETPQPRGPFDDGLRRAASRVQPDRARGRGRVQGLPDGRWRSPDAPVLPPNPANSGVRSTENRLGTGATK